MRLEEEKDGAPRSLVWLPGLMAVAGVFFAPQAFGGGTPFPLLISSNSLYLSAGEITNSGALFFYEAADLPALSTNPALYFQTNTPLASDLLLPMEDGAESPPQEFFFSASFPGRLAGEFGDAEYMPPSPPPDMVLFVGGLSNILVANQDYTVDFCVTDPAGSLLTNLSGAAQILVVNSLDGSAQPGVTVTPNQFELSQGTATAVQFSIQSVPPLSGCALGIGPVSGGAALDAILPAFNLLTNTLLNLRANAADPNTNWSCPISASFQIAGTFGEWRGTGNWDAHEGLDLAAGASNPVGASRGGVVSALGAQAGQGAWVVLDHGDGWFSRYLHLDSNSVAVVPGQIVPRGAVLATNLYAAAGWQSGLHFEIRANGQAQWGNPLPGAAQDPLQTPGIFAPPAGTGSPQLEVFGVTQQHPGQYPFAKSPPNSSLSGGPVYLFTQFVDDETNLSGGDYPLGPRSMTFQAAGMSQPLTIQPSNDVAISLLRIPGGTNQTGFAEYGPLDAANPDRQNWFRYWWAWDTSSYATNPIGPETVVLTGQSYEGATVTNTLTFGPEVQNNVWIPTPGKTNDFTASIIAHLGSSGSPSLVQPDQYQLQVLNGDGTPVPGVVWDGAVSGNLTKVFETNLDSEAFTFHLPASPVVSNMILRVSSLMSPNLADEVTRVPALVEIPAGTFVMGSPDSEPGRSDYEGPQTTNTFTYSFKMGKYPVTQAQYLAVMGVNPSYFQFASDPPDAAITTNYPALPVESVTWMEATNYCGLLTAMEQNAGRLPTNWCYRLPTQAEWEYCCRAGTTTPFCYGPNLLSGMANFWGKVEYEESAPSLAGWPGGTVINNNGVWLALTSDVGSFAPNAWGLYDTVGNVYEWCQDWWAASYPGGSVTNWQQTNQNTSYPYKIERGGAWGSEGAACRSAARIQDYPDERALANSPYALNATGFRIVLAPINPP